MCECTKYIQFLRNEKIIMKKYIIEYKDSSGRKWVLHQVFDSLRDAIKVLKENSSYEIFEVIPIETLEEKYSVDVSGTLFVKTDWDFSLELNGKFYYEEEFSLILTLEELDSIKVMGPYGSPSSGRVEAIETALEAIRAKPRESFSNLGGNRGASWYPSE